ncbi:MAG TPA: YncE family protein [Acidobacteriaceae bacterium]|nr:YncE family protein [Acidobacteriaceae bacterium]
MLSGIAVLAAGCGNQYRPVITPIQPTGPASQPTADVTVISQPGFTPLPAGDIGPCQGVTYANPSIITLVDFSGDSIMNEADGGYGPLTYSLEAGGANVYAPNCDGTLTTAQATTANLLTKYVQTSTLLPGSAPTNTLLAGINLYVTESGLHGPTCMTTNCVAQLTGSPEGLKQEIPVAPSLINVTGYSTGERVYAISQGNSNGGAQPAWGDCANPSSVTVDGEADAIETATNTVSARLPLGICPVFGFQTPDELRNFVMNRGSGTVTVINTQLNAIDSAHPTITVGAGPVYADYYRPGQILVTSNYDGNSISIIDVSLDLYGNDSSTFGTVLATVPVGLHPVEVSVLQDGSRVYVANQGVIGSGGSVSTPGSVTIVNLENYTVEKTIALTSNPHAIGSIYNYPIGKVYVASQNSPYLTVIRTDTDIVSATPEMQGNIIDMHVTEQYPGNATPGSVNYQTESRSVGSGAP